MCVCACVCVCVCACVCVSVPADVEPRLFWLKKACPACYTFPFDDMSSTFVCSNIDARVNTLNYEITICP